MAKQKTEAEQKEQEVPEQPAQPAAKKTVTTKSLAEAEKWQKEGRKLLAIDSAKNTKPAEYIFEA